MRIFVIKPACRVWRSRCGRARLRGAAPTPKAVVVYIGKLGAGAGVVLDGKFAAGFAGELTICRLNTNSPRRIRARI
ncbi:MAG: hypothetical protein ACLRIO_01460 [Butyricicoccus sp.]